MIENRSMPTSTVIPVLSYPDVETASQWLCEAFGFEIRLMIGNHRAQLGFADGAVVVTELKSGGLTRTGGPFAVMVRVEDVDAHHRRAARHGAAILSRPTSHPYGERQYSCRDLAGHNWTFSQSFADVAPREWGAIVVAGSPNGPDVES
ncbi:glyoxalase [Mesorhizobium sp. M7A.F.Ca.US.006.04.2.1]|nr:MULTISPECIES: VOC family protein [unclassified Mesorhizobium]RUX70723.1 glyoxalase [Mesorhizobium sp. M7A.F.Ca.US.005.03.1.1]RUY12301.1 glyoxalase [Mesorhizobium sp. M7A.F.Ca.US.005.03.2.1]RVA75622.1 glyoxalase [Mesorhizobium sp. M7A.F.Ca.US.006.04.2.1]